MMYRIILSCTWGNIDHYRQVDTHFVSTFLDSLYSHDFSVESIIFWTKKRYEQRVKIKVHKRQKPKSNSHERLLHLT